MSSSGTPAPSTNTGLLYTIETDLAAGESWLISEAESVGTYVWNTLKAAFIALGPAEAQIAVTFLSSIVSGLGAGTSIEDTTTAALNTAKGQELAILQKAGTGVVNQLVAGIKANIPAAPPAS